MKKLFIATVLAISIATASFATDVNKISYTVKENFKKDFNGAENVEWTAKKNFIKASFMLDSERCNAFYDDNGNQIGMCRYITLDDLSLGAKRTIAKKYPGYKITEAIEFSGPQENAIYLSAENEKEKVVVKITDFSSVSTFKKDRKD